MITLAGIVFAIALQQTPEFSPQQRQALHDALYIANLEEKNLKTEGAWGIENAYVAQIHRDPLAIIAALEPANSSENLIGRMRRKYFSEELVKRPAKSREYSIPEEIPTA